MAAAALHEALNKGISTGNLVDTKIILYSHRDSSGRVCRPKALYANSHVLRTVPYFNDLLFGNFAESQFKDFREEIDEEGFADDYGYLSDSDLGDDEDEQMSLFQRTTGSEVHSATPSEDNIPCEEYKEHAERGKVVRIPDIAYITFQAFLAYLYTNAIQFAPFGSEGNRRSRSAEIVNTPPDSVPQPSPKSVYRLADKYDILSLKTRALDHIRDGLEKCDIVEESFSRFAFQYDEIRSLYVEQLAFVLMEDSTMETTRVGVDKKIDNFVEGGLEHATEVLSALWEIVNKDGDIKGPSKTVPLSLPEKLQRAATIPPHFAAVEAALIESIRNGIFFDRKYWARYSADVNLLRPVYFSSRIMGDKAQRLRELVKRFKCQNSLMSDLEEGIDVESDCEGDLPEVQDQLLNEGSEETRAVLTKGSFSAWKSLFFYCRTAEISFAPLRSQGIDSRLKYVRDKATVVAPAPCSPKSIYVLAGLLGIQPLCDRAFADIRSKLSSDNIVDEVFSRLTSSQEKITEMQCELLISNFQNPKTIARVKENIGRSSNGSSPHCGGVLKLGLKKAIEFKKNKGQPSGVLLRCGYVGCPQHNTPVSYSSVGSNTFCWSLTCGSCRRCLVCVDCGYKRTGDYASCQGCGKKFI